MKRKEINVGDKFGKLTIIREVEPNITPCGTKQRKFLCKCECGNEVVRIMQTLLRGAKTSCGCDTSSYIQKYFNKESKSFLYSTWIGIRQRCNNPNNSSYKNYGGRGVSICKEWNDDFLAFQKWSKENGAQVGLQIDRIDVNGNYEPSNCRWVDTITQANNKRSNRVIEYRGEKHTVMEWSRKTGVKESVIRSRIDKYGCTIGQALGYEEYDGSPDHIIEYNGERHNITEWAYITGINKGTISSRLRYGYSVGQALGFEEYKRKAPPKYITYNGETHSLTGWERITGVNRKVISSRLNRGLSVAQALGIKPYERKKSSYVAPTKKVLEFDLNGNFIKEWDSVLLAATHYATSSTAIRYACNGVTHSSCNRIWKYKN